MDTLALLDGTVIEVTGNLFSNKEKEERYNWCYGIRFGEKTVLAIARIKCLREANSCGTLAYLLVEKEGAYNYIGDISLSEDPDGSRELHIFSNYFSEARLHPRLHGLIIRLEQDEHRDEHGFVEEAQFKL